MSVSVSVCGGLTVWPGGRVSCLAEWVGVGVCVCVWWTDCLSGRAAGCRVWRSGPVSVSVCGGLTVCLAGRQGVVSGGVGRCLCLCLCVVD